MDSPVPGSGGMDLRITGPGTIPRAFQNVVHAGLDTDGGADASGGHCVDEKARHGLFLGGAPGRPAQGPLCPAAFLLGPYVRIML